MMENAARSRDVSHIPHGRTEQWHGRLRRFHTRKRWNAPKAARPTFPCAEPSRETTIYFVYRRRSNSSQDLPRIIETAVQSLKYRVRLHSGPVRSGDSRHPQHRLCDCRDFVLSATGQTLQRRRRHAQAQSSFFYSASQSGSRDAGRRFLSAAKAQRTQC